MAVTRRRSKSESGWKQASADRAPSRYTRSPPNGRHIGAGGHLRGRLPPKVPLGTYTGESRPWPPAPRSRRPPPAPPDPAGE